MSNWLKRAKFAVRDGRFPCFSDAISLFLKGRIFRETGRFLRGSGRRTGPKQPEFAN